MAYLSCALSARGAAAQPDMQQLHQQHMHFAAKTTCSLFSSNPARAASFTLTEHQLKLQLDGFAVKSRSLYPDEHGQRRRQQQQQHCGM